MLKLYNLPTFFPSMDQRKLGVGGGRCTISLTESPHWVSRHWSLCELYNLTQLSMWMHGCPGLMGNSWSSIHNKVAYLECLPPRGWPAMLLGCCLSESQTVSEKYMVLPPLLLKPVVIFDVYGSREWAGTGSFKYRFRYFSTSWGLRSAGLEPNHTCSCD